MDQYPELVLFVATKTLRFANGLLRIRPLTLEAQAVRVAVLSCQL